MGHFVFIILHLIAIVFGFVLLIITIPLHIIYSCMVNSGREKQKLLEIMVKKNAPEEYAELQKESKVVYGLSKKEAKVLLIIGVIAAVLCGILGLYH